MYAEYIFVFPPLFLLFLMTTQLALMLAADLGVRHAANVTARAAVVVLPEDPFYYDGAAANQFVSGGDCGEQGLGGALGGISDALGGGRGSGANKTPSGILNSLLNCEGGPRKTAIRTAGALSLLPFGRSPGFLREKGTLAGLGGLAVYAASATAVTFPVEPGSDELKPNDEEYAIDDLVHVRVSFAFPCAVPIAEMILCEDYFSYKLGVSRDAATGGGTVIDRAKRQKRLRDRRAAEKVGFSEIDQHATVNRFALPLLAAFEGLRMRVLSAEASLPIQRAGPFYRYTRP